MDNTTPNHRKQHFGLSGKEMEEITVAQLLCAYEPEFTSKPDEAFKELERMAEEAKEADDSILPVQSVVLIGVN